MILIVIRLTDRSIATIRCFPIRFLIDWMLQQMIDGKFGRFTCASVWLFLSRFIIFWRRYIGLTLGNTFSTCACPGISACLYTAHSYLNLYLLFLSCYPGSARRFSSRSASDERRCCLLSPSVSIWTKSIFIKSIASSSYEAGCQARPPVPSFPPNISSHRLLSSYTRLLFSLRSDRKSMSRILKTAPFLNDHTAPVQV